MTTEVDTDINYYPVSEVDYEAKMAQIYEGQGTPELFDKILINLAQHYRDRSESLGRSYGRYSKGAKAYGRAANVAMSAIINQKASTKAAVCVEVARLTRRQADNLAGLMNIAKGVAKDRAYQEADNWQKLALLIDPDFDIANYLNSPA